MNFLLKFILAFLYKYIVINFCSVYQMRLAPAKVCRVVTTCVILLNIAYFLHESDVEEFEENDLDVGNERCLNDRRDGAAVREFFIQQYFALILFPIGK
jgi:hypothetical protein